MIPWDGGKRIVLPFVVPVWAGPNKTMPVYGAGASNLDHAEIRAFKTAGS